jgi:hypothetical protein
LHAVNALRRTLYLQAAAWAVAGLVLGLAPGVASGGAHVWVRLLGVQAFVLAMLMVLVGHRVEDLWWWSWAFAFLSMACTAVALLHGAFGHPRGTGGAAAWWVLSLVLAGFTLSLLYGLFVTSRQNPFP